MAIKSQPQAENFFAFYNAIITYHYLIRNPELVMEAQLNTIHLPKKHDSI